ncbi:hypothetical protein [Roseococcus sp. YIM B11640]|uniref:hypothetical protein n=1 Tax=Roseococcus sp. YIM B11640 TaxID=3133973 RepID=UPI003C7B3270
MTKRMGLLAVVGIVAGAGAAGATGMSVNHVPLQPGTTIASCLQRAAIAIASTGLRPLNTTATAAWGEREGGRIFSIYCLPDNNVAIFIGAGNSSREVSPDVTSLMNAFRDGAGGGGGAPRK